MKKLLTCLSILLILSACSTKNDNLSSLDAIKEKKEMVVGYTNYPPLGFKDETGKETGLDLELATEVGKILGVEVKFQYIDWDNKTFELNNKNIDMIWNGFTITDKRKEEVNFGKAYMDNQIVILSRSDKPIKTIAELKGLDVAVETQSSGQAAIEKNAIIEDIKELQKYTDIQEGLLALNAKTVDAVIADVTYAGYTQNKNPENYVISDEKFDSEFYAIGFRKNDDDTLKNAIDDAIDQLIASGVTKDISIKWLGKDLIVRP